ncbi:arsenate reductase [Mesorhizobium sp. CAU 1732]|uniref:arsenate reductase n=1 Tax=Mesorhizobium sp. CAU 1732 TaxID=3140358 RepID=UPI003260CE83
MSVTIYGIKTCDTMKKAFAWLDANGVDYTFHDYRVDGVSRGDVQRWCDAAGWQKVLNAASRTFRALPEDARADLDEAKAIALMVAEPTMIKRPVLDTGNAIEIGFKPARYEELFGA